MENECEASPGVAYPGVRDNRSTINTKTGCDVDPVPDVDSGSLFHFSHHYRIGDFRRFISISHTV